MAELPLCDKCWNPVDPNNDSEIVSRIYLRLIGNPQDYYMHQSNNLISRHFLPIETCEGSTSRSQYIEGQLRDTRGMTYREEEEAFWRKAYEEAQTVK